MKVNQEYKQVALQEDHQWLSPSVLLVRPDLPQFKEAAPLEIIFLLLNGDSPVLTMPSRLLHSLNIPTDLESLPSLRTNALLAEFPILQ